MARGRYSTDTITLEDVSAMFDALVSDFDILAVVEVDLGVDGLVVKARTDRPVGRPGQERVYVARAFVKPRAGSSLDKVVWGVLWDLWVQIDRENPGTTLPQRRPTPGEFRSGRPRRK